MSNVVAASLQFSFDGRVLTDSEELCQFDLVNTQASPVVVLIDDSIYDISYVSLMNSRASKQLPTPCPINSSAAGQQVMINPVASALSSTAKALRISECSPSQKQLVNGE
jgi:hypothetical protein